MNAGRWIRHAKSNGSVHFALNSGERVSNALVRTSKSGITSRKGSLIPDVVIPKSQRRFERRPRSAQLVGEVKLTKATLGRGLRPRPQRRD